MATNIKGINVVIGGSSTKLVEALRDVNSEVKNTQTELKSLDKLLKLDPGNLDLVAQKQEKLKDAIGATKDKLNILKTAQEQVERQFKEGTLGKDKHYALQQEIAKTEAKLKDLAKEAADANSALTKIGDVGSAMQKAGSTMTSAGKTLTTYVTAPILGLGTMAVKTGADFDESMSKVKAISGAIGEDFDALRDKAREMGAKTKFSAQESADAFSYMAMAGWDTNKMLDGIEGVMALAAASGEDLAKTSDIVTDAMSAFGLEAKDAGHFSDVLAAASNNANTNVGLLGESFKYIATSAGTYKFSAEDTAVALGLMANMGIKGTQSGTELKNAMVNLTKPTKQQAEAMQKLGWMTTEYVHSVDSDKVTKAQRGVEKATLDVQTAQTKYNKILSELSENSSQAVSANERVQKAQDKVNTATKNVTEAQKKYDQAVKDYGKDSPQAQKAHQQLQSAQEKLASATKDLNSAQEKYGKAVANNTADSPKAVAARNALEKAQLNLKDAQDKLDKATQGTTKAVAGQNLILSDDEGNVRSLDDIMQIMRATLGEVDVEITDANGTVKDFDTLMQEAADHGADLTQVEKLQAAATIFGKQNMAGMLAIINSSQKDYDKLSSSVRNCTYKYDDITEALMNTKLGFEEMSTSAEKEGGWEFGEYWQRNIDDIIRYLNDAGGDTEKAFQRLMGYIQEDGDLIYGYTEEQARAAIDIVKNSMDSFDGTAKETAEVMQDNLKGQLTILKSALQELAIQISDALTPTIRNIVEKVQSVVEKLQQMDEGTRNSILKWGLFIAAIGPVLIILGKLTSGIGTVLTSFASIGKGILNLWNQFQLGVGVGARIGQVFATLTSGPVVALIAGIGLLVAAFVHLWNTNEDFRNKVKEIWESVKTAFKALVDALSDLLKALEPVFDAAVAALKVIWEEFCHALAPILDGVFEIITGILQGAVDILSGILKVFVGLFTGDWDKFWEGIKQIFEGVWETMQGWFQGLWTIWSGLIENFFRVIGAVWEAGWNAIKATGEMIWNMISSFFSLTWDGLKSVVTTILSAIATAISAAWDGIATVFSTVWGGIKTGFTAIWDAIKDYVEVTLRAIGSVIEAAFKIITVPFMFIWENCKEGIIEAWDKIKSGVSESLELISGLIEKIWDSISSWLSSCLETIRKSMSEAWDKIQCGISETSELISGIIEKIWTGISDWLSSCAETIWKAVTDSWDKIKSGINETCELISGLIERIWTGISNWLSGCLDGIYNYVSRRWDAVKDYTSSVWDRIKDYFLGIWDTIKEGITTRVSNMWEAIKSPFITAYEWISNQLKRIRDLFSFEWSLPKIKLPHFKIEGKFSLAPPSVPSLSIEWYKKAMDDAYFINGATIFGAKGSTLLGGGEAGQEVIVGTEKLASIVKSSVSEVMQSFGTKLEQNTIGKLYQSGQNSFSEAIDELKERLQEALSAVATGVGDTWTAAKTTINDAIAKISQKLNEVLQAAYNSLTSYSESFSDTINNIAQSIKDKLEKLGNQAVVTIADVQNIIKNALQSLVSKASNQFTSLGNVIQNLIVKAQTILSYQGQTAVSSQSTTRTMSAAQSTKALDTSSSTNKSSTAYKTPTSIKNTSTNNTAQEWKTLLDQVVKAQKLAEVKYQNAQQVLCNMQRNPDYISNVNIATQQSNVSSLEKESLTMQKLLEWVSDNARSGESIETKITVPVYIGSERIDELVARVTSNQNYRSGGR